MTVPGNEPPGIIDQGFGLMGQQGQQSEGQQDQLPGMPQQGGQQEPNPMWKPILDKLPGGLHGVIMPELQQWEKNYTQGMQKVHSDYEPLKAYQPFLEQQVDPAQLNEAMLVYQAMQNDPATFVQAVQEFYKLEQGQLQQQQDPDDDGSELPFDINQVPEWQQQQQLIQTMAQAMIAQNEQSELAQAESQLNDEFAQAQEKYKAQGGFDEEYVALQMLQHGMSMDDAVAKYFEFTQGIISGHQRPGAQAPVLMGGGGGLPSQQVPVGDMSPQNRRAYIAQRLAQAQQQGG